MRFGRPEQFLEILSDLWERACCLKRGITSEFELDTFLIRMDLFVLPKDISKASYSLQKIERLSNRDPWKDMSNMIQGIEPSCSPDYPSFQGEVNDLIRMINGYEPYLKIEFPEFAKAHDSIKILLQNSLRHRDATPSKSEKDGCIHCLGLSNFVEPFLKEAIKDLVIYGKETPGPARKDPMAEKIRRIIEETREARLPDPIVSQFEDGFTLFYDHDVGITLCCILISHPYSPYLAIRVPPGRSGDGDFPLDGDFCEIIRECMTEEQLEEGLRQSIKNRII
jgi:hypothetical protein